MPLTLARAAIWITRELTLASLWLKDQAFRLYGWTLGKCAKYIPEEE